MNLWYVEAGTYDVLPIDNRSIAELVADMPVADIPEGGIYRYYPGTLDLPEFNAAEIRGRSFKILARVEISDLGVQGVILAVGSRFGGHTLFVKNRNHRCEGPWKTEPGHFSLCGEGLTIGRDSGDSVSKEYQPYYAFTGGRIHYVEISVGDDAYVDLERDLHAGLARD